MLRDFFCYTFVCVFFLVLSSCARVEKTDTYRLLEGAGAEKFPAWTYSGSEISSTSAVAKELLKQADDLIAEEQLDKASDKLDRLLRLEPVCAQAWSRLAWIAMQNNSPKRTQQMAQRSNSHAQDNLDLKILNWTFIKEAAHLQGDEPTYIKAENVLERLRESE